MGKGKTDGARRANRLINETSTYLKQHAYNPVDWYPWSEEALERARNESKPILLSIGYAACHWCHVMEHESFEDSTTAGIMNDNFINIKVDREERTDLDEIYMKAVQLLTGHGGWPMTVFLTPELKPFFAGTYFPPQDRHGMPSFSRVLTGVSNAWREKREEVVSSAQEITDHLKAFDQLSTQEDSQADSSELNRSIVEDAARKLDRIFDPKWGGFGGAPKFPHTFCLSLAMRCISGPYDEELKKSCREIVTTTLDRMAYGGMHDHLGGGFARYSVDRQWLIPHFEKMLYDNALLSRSYLEGYRLLGVEYWKEVAGRTLDFVSRELSTPEGAFYSSLDADSEGEEGKFYVWTPGELREVVGDGDGKWLEEAFSITDMGNFEHGTSVFNLKKSPAQTAGDLDMSEEDFWKRFDPLREKLLSYREKRIRPTRDEKVLTSWNSLMISAFLSGYLVFEDDRYFDRAERALNFILEHLVQDGKLLRTWGDGKAKLAGYLDDHAFLVQALLDMAAADADPRWLELAITFNDFMLEQFVDETNGGFFFTSKDHEELVVRPKSHFDGSVPSGTSVAIHNLERLYWLTGKNQYRDSVEQVLRLYRKFLSRSPDQFANMLCALDMHLTPGRQIVLVVEDEDRSAGNKPWHEKLFAIHSRHCPNDIVIVYNTLGNGKSTASPLLEGKVAVEGNATVYICQNYACDKPLTEVAELEKSLARG